MNEYQERGLKKVNMQFRPTICTECRIPLKFQGRGVYRCPSCGKEEYDDFGKIRKFLDENGPASAVVISAATGVPIPTINGYLRQGRMEVKDGSGDYIHCEQCGCAIRFGRYCPECAAKLSKDIKGFIGPSEVGERPKSRMHIEADRSGKR